jgi:hypothetical protein
LVAKAKGSASKRKPLTRKSAAKSRAKTRSRRTETTNVDPARVMGWVGTASTNGSGSRTQDSLNVTPWSAAASGSPTHLAHMLVETQMEMAALVGRRSRAYLDFPEHLVKCRTPQQILEHQARFIQDMVQDYNTTNDRIMRSWLQAPARDRS